MYTLSSMVKCFLCWALTLAIYRHRQYGCTFVIHICTYIWMITKCEGFSTYTFQCLEKQFITLTLTCQIFHLSPNYYIQELFMHIKEKIPTVTKACLSALTKGTLLAAWYKITHRAPHTYIHTLCRSSKRWWSSHTIREEHCIKPSTVVINCGTFLSSLLCEWL